MRRSRPVETRAAAPPFPRRLRNVLGQLGAARWIRFRDGPLLFPRREWGGPYQRRGRQVREEELIERKCLQQRERAPEDANARKHGVFIFVASVPGYVIP